jgi:hypothetical protein
MSGFFSTGTEVHRNDGGAHESGAEHRFYAFDTIRGEDTDAVTNLYPERGE